MKLHVTADIRANITAASYDTADKPASSLPADAPPEFQDKEPTEYLFHLYTAASAPGGFRLIRRTGT
jgi:hypothetical protein